MNRKLLLVNPRPQVESWWNNSHLKLPPYGLATLATLVPKNWEIEISDERIGELNFEEEADLVGITTMTSTSPRAYEIAENFLKRRIPVVLGGIHPTVCTEEALKHATSVVKGRAEGIFSKLIEDFERGEIKRVYEGKDCVSTRPARYDLLARYSISLVQTSHGCRYSCEFCSVPLIYGHKPRYRDLETIRMEVQRSPLNRIMIADDNFFGVTREDREHTEGVLRMLSTMGIRWAGQATIDIANDTELLELAKESGCSNLLIGFESINKDSLREAKKGANLRFGADNFARAIEKLHKYGISVTGTFIFGFDSDNKDVFERTVDFVRRTGLDTNRFEILTPLPGTRLYNRLNNEGRIIRKNYPNDWQLYDCCHAVFKPKNMTSEELELSTLEAFKETSSPLQCVVRGIKTLLNTGNLYGAGISYLLNTSTGGLARERLHSQYMQ